MIERRPEPCACVNSSFNRRASRKRQIRAREAGSPSRITDFRRPTCGFPSSGCGGARLFIENDRERSAFGGVVELILLEFIAERGEVELEHFGGLASVASGLLHGLAEEVCFEAGHDLLEG